MKIGVLEGEGMLAGRLQQRLPFLRREKLMQATGIGPGPSDHETSWLNRIMKGSNRPLQVQGTIEEPNPTGSRPRDLIGRYKTTETPQEGTKRERRKKPACSCGVYRL